MDHRKRVHRPRGYNDPGHAHELTFSCFRQLKMFTKDRSCEWLAVELAAGCRELNYALWAYVFMPEHLHLIVYPRERDYDTSVFLERIKGPVGRQEIRFLKQEAPEWLPRIQVKDGDSFKHHFWQPGRGHDRNVTLGRTLLKMIDYIHLNPVRRGLVAQGKQWKWSSAGWFEGTPLNDLAPDPIPADWLEDAD